MSAAQQLGSAAAARVGEALVRTCFAERVEAARVGGFATYEPWPPMKATAHGDDIGADLWRLAHLGLIERKCFDDGLWADLCAVDLIEDGNPAAPGRFELTAHRSLIAARDRPGYGRLEGAPPIEAEAGAGRRGEHSSVRGGVHIGEDSLRFAEAILGVAPRGIALDVGSGSGISTCALARTCEQVHAIDVVEACLDATALSMGLNGMGAKANVSLAQLDAYEAPLRFDCAIGNLPGVPVPPGLDYPPDGAGGPDGLQLMRLFLERCEASLLSERGVAIMRFQSLGDGQGPLLLAELHELAGRAGWDISVLTESRIPASVRAALTAHHALPVNAGIEPSAMLARADAHLAEMGHSEYYASTLFARPTRGARGSVIYTDLSGPSLVGRALHRTPAAHVAELMGSAIPAYYGRAHDLPDSFFELGSLDYIHQPALRLEQVLECLREPLTVPELVERVFAQEVAIDPIRARFLQVTVELLGVCLVQAGAASLQG
jgi:hypothetical protein